MRTSTLFFVAAFLSFAMLLGNAVMFDGIGAMIVGAIFGGAFGYTFFSGCYLRKDGD